MPACFTAYVIAVVHALPGACLWSQNLEAATGHQQAPADPCRGRFPTSRGPGQAVYGRALALAMALPHSLGPHAGCCLCHLATQCHSIRSAMYKKKKKKERKRKYYAFQRQFNEKPSITLGCPDMNLTMREHIGLKMVGPLFVPSCICFRSLSRQQESHRVLFLLMLE